MNETAPIISIRGVTKRFGPVTAVDDVSLDIRPNEFFALLGPSGCGKTTLLRMLAGLEVPSAGAILIDGHDVTGVPPNRRPVNMVFQSYAVFPHMSVFDNVAYGLRVVKTPAGEIEPRVREALAMTQLEGLAARKPDQLSGGQRQRVALARALVKRPKVLLLDEPLSALDAKLREAMQLELVRLQHSVGITFIIVTHDQNEALSMANRIAVMEAGQIRQVARPAELYEYPNCRFVADFIGKMNLFEGRVVACEDARVHIEVKGVGRLALPADQIVAPAPGSEVGVAVRPEKIRLHREPAPEGRVRLRGRVSEVAYFGDASHVYLVLEGGPKISANLQNEARTAVPGVVAGDELWCSWDPNDTLVLTR
ncbi:MAG: ABC transporter ATP-binding protein [Alphaproteobacteria bacterium]|nr:MAG: ABC transporter ATP-binding protein [Alphaproteobacteria bacterium]